MTASLRTTGAPAPEPPTISYNEISEINPLINLPAGDTAAVIAVLGFLAKAFIRVDTNDGIKLDYIDAWGLACLLKTCASALKIMTLEGRKA
jgi:hypothetical protein